MAIFQVYQGQPVSSQVLLLHLYWKGTSGD